MVDHVYVDIAASDKCYNIYESYGEICIGCGCCAIDPEIRVRARLEMWKRRLEALETDLRFNWWVDYPEIRELQVHNLMIDIERAKRRIRYYQRRLADLQRATE